MSTLGNERFLLERLLGRGGGGEVWAGIDQLTGSPVAIKLLHEGGGPAEAEALLRETTALSGLEGLGFPKVVWVGRSAEGRLYLARELVDGQSLESLAEQDPRRALSLLCAVADVLTVVHRAGLLHGDVKPANVIVRSDGQVALVDLGLAAALRDAGPSAGMTPHYAAPELLAGGQPSPQSEVYALGVTLGDFLELGADRGRSDEQSQAILAVLHRATDASPARRFPSADEFSQALRLALGGDAPAPNPGPTPWPVLGIEAPATALQRKLEALSDGQRLAVIGRAGSGTSTLLKRLGWALAMSDRPVALVDPGAPRLQLIRQQIEAVARPGAVIVVDGDPAELEAELRQAQQAGARLVVAATSVRSAAASSAADQSFELPPLDQVSVERLLQGALPSLRRDLVQQVSDRLGAWPGALRDFVSAAGGRPIASSRDIDEVLGQQVTSQLPPLERAQQFLDRGRYDDARQALLQAPEGAATEWLWARQELATGSPASALERLDRLLEAGVDDLEHQVEATRARALLGLGRYQEAVDALHEAAAMAEPPRSEALAYRGLGLTLLGRLDEARTSLKQAVSSAREAGSERLVALAESSLGTAEWRAGRSADSERSFRAAIEAAASAGDSGILSTSQINLAGLLKERGELAESISLLESAVDAADRAGRTTSAQQARLNLSNTNLYLGRLERARAEIQRIGAPQTLAGPLRAQLHGLRAELVARSGDVEAALPEFEACEQSWAELGRKREAAEAALEAVLALAGAADSANRSSVDRQMLSGMLDRGREHLETEVTPLSRLAEARCLALQGKSKEAEKRAAEARELAESAGQREWAWRAATLQAELWRDAGQETKAERALRDALEILEDIAARLPDDLRAVYWSDERRRALRQREGLRRRSEAPQRGASGSDSLRPAMFVRQGRITTSAGSDVVSRLSQTPLERRLARILAINSDLAGEVDLSRLAEKIVAHAAELLAAERGYLLLGASKDELEVCAARGGQGAEHEGFSRSLAGRVLDSGQPLVSIDAERDQRLRAFESVHLNLVSAVACVPILSPRGEAVGALYLETRGGARPDFAGELPTLQAFADQAAIALENARLLGHLQAQSRELEEKNQRLSEARERLKEALGRRTERLRQVRQELRSTKDKLAGHSVYRGLVGASESMRRIYGLIDRVKDTDVPVLITGESGTGKEVVARAIHEGSPRSKRKMLAVNCGAIPQSILESELFGHVRGAFTGASTDRRGLFRDADGGVLFLDEIGEMPLKMQASLLRVLQEQRVRPVGGSQEVPIDVRVVFATNRDLREAVERGKFREDLLYRIQVVEVALPPLRARQDDIPLLVDHFLERFAVRFGQNKKPLSRAALARLMQHPLPGNVRQLENALLNAWVMSEGNIIEEADIELPAPRPSSRPASFEARLAEARPAADSRSASADDEPSSAAAARRGTVSEHERDERQQIVDALDRTGWNRVRAAEVLGMPRRTFYRRLKQYGIQ